MQAPTRELIVIAIESHPPVIPQGEERGNVGTLQQVRFLLKRVLARHLEEGDLRELDLFERFPDVQGAVDLELIDDACFDLVCCKRGPTIALLTLLQVRAILR